jgi:hypothetical protein
MLAKLKPNRRIRALPPLANLPVRGCVRNASGKT